MTLAEVKELERLKVQEAASMRAKEFDAKQNEIDRTIPQRSGAWHEARTNLAFSRIEADIEGRLAIRKAMIERCPDLAAPYETRQFEQRTSSVVEDCFQAALRNLSVGSVRPLASVLREVPTRKLALQQRVRTAARMMQLEGPQQPLPTSQNQPRGPLIQPSKRFRFQIALSFPGEQRPRVQKIAEALAASVGKENILYDQWHRAEFARPNLDVYLPKLYHEDALLLVFFLCGGYAQKEWCGLEWRAGRDLLKQKEDDRLMFLRLDDADIPGLLSIDGCLDIRRMPDNEVAVDILNRLAILGPLPLGSPSDSSSNPVVTRRATAPDPDEFWQQLKGLPGTDVMRRIWSKPRWRIWIRPTEFRRARFQNLEQCWEFMHSSCVHVQGWFPYPGFSTASPSTGGEWIAGEVDESNELRSHAECWALSRSGQFVHNLAFDEIPQLGDRIHVLEILNTLTAAFEFAARMAEQCVLSPEAAITFELYGVDGRELTWPQDESGYSNAVGPNCWCQDDSIRVSRVVPPDELQSRRRELALEVALEIYSKFRWSDPPGRRLTNEQDRSFRTAQQGQD